MYKWVGSSSSGMRPITILILLFNFLTWNYYGVKDIKLVRHRNLVVIMSKTLASFVALSMTNKTGSNWI